MRELAVYRMNLGLPSTPQPHEPYPLVMALNDGGIHPEAPPQHASLGATESPQNGVNPAQLRPLTRATIHRDRKSTRLNSSHVAISYAVFCLKKKKDAEHAAISHDSDHTRYVPRCHVRQ